MDILILETLWWSEKIMNSKWAIFHWNVHPPCWALGEISLWYVRWHHGRVKNKEYWWGHINPGIPRLAKSLVHPGPGLHVCQKSLFSDIFPWVVPWLQADRARGTYSVDMWRVTYILNCIFCLRKPVLSWSSRNIYTLELLALSRHRSSFSLRSRFNYGLSHL